MKKGIILRAADQPPRMASRLSPTTIAPVPQHRNHSRRTKTPAGDLETVTDDSEAANKMQVEKTFFCENFFQKSPDRAVDNLPEASTLINVVPGAKEPEAVNNLLISC